MIMIQAWTIWVVMGLQVSLMGLLASNHVLNWRHRRAHQRLVVALEEVKAALKTVEQLAIKREGNEATAQA